MVKLIHKDHEYYSTKEIISMQQLCGVTSRELILSEKSQSQKVAYYIIP